jgi:DNA topoisomerase IB
VPRLRYVDPAGAGLARRRRGRGFEYLDEGGARIQNAATLERIRALAIPPAWSDVWICPAANGYIQAVGTDDAGRRQYLYHDDWRAARDRAKFERMLDFATSMPTVRETVAEHLALRGVPRERTLAGATRLLDLGFFRIGGESYAEANETFGLVTLLKRHVRVGRSGALIFDYVAKGGQRRRQRIVDRDVSRLVTQLKRRRHGPELLAYKDGGRWVDVRSSDVNDYIKAVAGGDFTAKDFRTWHATVLAAAALSVYGRAARSRTARSRVVGQAVREVAHYLGNTPAVCRASYIDPRVFELYDEGVTIESALEQLAGLESFEPDSFRAAAEESVLELLR